MQWDPDSYFVYRNVFDNLVTRDVAGKIVPQAATVWSYQSDTQIVFTMSDDIRFEDGSLLTPDDVVFYSRSEARRGMPGHPRTIWRRITGKLA